MYNTSRNHLPPNGSEPESTDEPLPIILAGPIVRRCEFDSSNKTATVNIWLATSKNFESITICVSNVSASGYPIMITSDINSTFQNIQISDYFWVWMLRVKFNTGVEELNNNIVSKNIESYLKIKNEEHQPSIIINNIKISPEFSKTIPDENWLKKTISFYPDPKPLASETLFAYDIHFLSKSTVVENGESLSSYKFDSLASIMNGNISAITLGKLELPIFSVQIEDQSLKCLFGSCRKAHGPGRDASIGMEIELEQALHSEDKEFPNALFLTGDQIYADDVNTQLLYAIKKLSSKLMKDEKLPLPWGDLYASSYILHTREEIIVRMRASEFYKKYKGARAAYVGLSLFTSTDSDNHLISFSEISSMYLLMWNDKLWDYVGDNVLKKELKDAYEGTQSIRRVLANIPTYMIVDDHDVTDDFYFDDEWKRKVLQSKSGSRLIANSLSSYWLFQDWGNKFDFDHRLSEMLHGYTMGDEARRRDYDIVFNNYHEWSFVAPTNPPAIFLNTRTRRVSDKEAKDEGRSIKDAAILINKAEYLHLESLFNTHIGEVTDRPIIVVSPSPILTLTSVEAGIKLKADMGKGWFKQGISKRDRLDYDIETFNSNAHTIHEFMMRILDIQPSHLIIVSGDVHYGTIGYGCLNKYKSGKKDIFISQLTSSALKNEATGLSLEALKLADIQDGYRHNTTYYYKRVGKEIISKSQHEIESWFYRYIDPDFLLKYDFVSTNEYLDIVHHRAYEKSNFGYFEKSVTSTKISVSIRNANNEQRVTFEGDTKKWPI